MTKRIIPSFLVAEGRVEDLSDAADDDPIELARYYEAAGADEIVIRESSQTSLRVQKLVDLVGEIVGRVFIPIIVGGGVDSVAKARALVRAGGDRVFLNTAAMRTPSLIDDCIAALGAERLILNVDARVDEAGHYQVYVEDARKATGKSVVEWVQAAVRRGIREVHVSNPATPDDAAFDHALVRTVCEAVPVPVVVRGLPETPDDFVALFRKTNAAGAIGSAAFHQPATSIKRVKRQCMAAGVAVRPLPRQTLRLTHGQTGRLPAEGEHSEPTTTIFRTDDWVPPPDESDRPFPR